MKHLVLTAVGLAGVFHALSPLPPRTHSAGVVQRRDTVVRMAGAPVHPGTATLKEEISIGVASGAQEYMIANLEDAHLGYDGSIFIADAGTAGGRIGALSTVRRYDSTGKFVRSYGRGGEGPGEFGDFNGMHLLRDGRFLLNDVRSTSVHVYSATGAPVADWLVPRTAGTTGFFMNPNGQMYMLLSTVPSATAPARRFAVHLTATGQIVDTIPAPVAPQMPNFSVTATTSTGTPRRSTVPFAPTFKSVFSPLGYWVTMRTDRYAIDLNMPDGHVVSIRRNAEAVPVSAEERNAYRTSIETSMRNAQPGWTWNGPDIPRTKPHAMDIVADFEGRIWVRIYDAAQKILPSMDMDDDAINYWDVFEPAGRYLGRVKTPVGAQPMSWGDWMIGVQRDANDVVRVIRYKIQWSAER